MGGGVLDAFEVWIWSLDMTQWFCASGLLWPALHASCGHPKWAVSHVQTLRQVGACGAGGVSEGPIACK